MNSWDAVTGLILVREAGGWTNGFLANDGLIVGSEVLAATLGLVEPMKGLTGFGSVG
jgi:myo-inositol-1(or 4)-monophosphatase